METQTVADRLRQAIELAILAPSSHNSQPWLFRIEGDAVEIYADRRRALPVVDPEDRELTISCGAALFVLEVALRRDGLAPSVKLLPDPERVDLLARVEVSAAEPSPESLELFAAITSRRTTRRAYAAEPFPDFLIQELAGLGDPKGGEVVVITEPSRRARIAELVAEGDREQLADPRFRRELAQWIHPARSGDGMPSYAFGVPELMGAGSPILASIIRTFDMGAGRAAKDQRLAEDSPALILIASIHDGPADWLAAGRLLAHVSLLLTARGFTSSYLNQPIEVENLRPLLREAMGARGVPQVLLRAGRGEPGPASPRRSVAEVMIDAPL